MACPVVLSVCITQVLLNNSHEKHSYDTKNSDDIPLLTVKYARMRIYTVMLNYYSAL